MATKGQKKKGEESSSDEDEGTPAEKCPRDSTGTPTKAYEQSVAMTGNEKDVNGLDNNPQEDDPLPGWTTSGKRIIQCSDPGDEHSPVV